MTDLLFLIAKSEELLDSMKIKHAIKRVCSDLSKLSQTDLLRPICASWHVLTAA